MVSMMKNMTQRHRVGLTILRLNHCICWLMHHFQSLQLDWKFYISQSCFQKRGLDQTLTIAQTSHWEGFLAGSVGKGGTCHIGGAGSVPGSGRSPGGGNGNPLQYSCLEKPMDRGAWRATVQGVARVRHDLATKPPPFSPKLPSLLYI